MWTKINEDLCRKIVDKGYVHFCQKVGAMNTKFDDKMNLESLKGCQ